MRSHYKKDREDEDAPRRNLCSECRKELTPFVKTTEEGVVMKTIGAKLCTNAACPRFTDQQLIPSWRKA